MNDNKIKLNLFKVHKLNAIIGTFWGDEGKGKITKALSQHVDYAVRFNGGPNAGHTIYHQNKSLVMRQIPSVINPNTKYLIGQATLINPKIFFNEYQKLKEIYHKEPEVYVSQKCHLILPYHITIDIILECLRGDKKIGTTLCGVGPCLTDKIRRCGIRICDLWNIKTLEDKINFSLKLAKPLYDAVKKPLPSVKEIIKENEKYFRFINKKKNVVERLLYHAIKDQKNIVFEAGQGCLLDLNHGTYPYVTSSSTICTSISNNVGLEIKAPINTIGCMKIYSTRVGKGPFPTEINDQTAKEIKSKGKEFGSVTGLPRRTGWFDLVVLKYAHKLNRFNSLAVTKVDILSGLKEIKICTGYEINKTKKYWDYLPSTVEGFSQIKPIYKTFPGYQLEKNKLYATYGELPINLKNILNFISAESNIPVKIISFGPHDQETIFL